MANVRALTIQSGVSKQQQDADTLVVGAGILTNAGNLSLGAAGTDVQVSAGKVLSFTGAGSGAVDFSTQSGLFKTTTGAVTIGPGAVGVSGTTTFSAAGTAVTVNNNLTVSGTLSVATFSISGTLQTSGLTTTGLAAGQIGYLSAASTLAKTDNASITTSRPFGVVESVAGSAAIGGIIPDMQFTTAGGQPTNGAAVFLAAASDDSSTGAGKASATSPIGLGAISVEVGICVDNANYASAKTCMVLWQVKLPIQL